MKKPFRIYGAADIHGKAERLAELEKNVMELKPDLLVLAGDITGFFQKNQTLKKLKSLNVETVAVRGNSDMLISDRDFLAFDIVPLHLATVRKEGLKIVGISGALPLPFHTRIRLREHCLEKELMAMVDKDTILVSHPPPFGTRDEVLEKLHAGSRLIKNVVDRRKPRIVLCGHIHERSGKSAVGQTTVVNCSFNKFCSGALIEWDGKDATIHFRNQERFQRA